MTLWDILRSAKRRWYVLLLGFLLTTVWVLAVGNMAGVYQSRTRIVLTLPPSLQESQNGIKIAPTSGRLIPFASVIVSKIDGGHSLRQSTSPDVTLVDEGIYDGWSIHVPDYGGQWASNINEPALILQATAPTAEAAEVRMRWLIDQVDHQVSDLQANVASPSRISYVASPTAVVVEYLRGRLTIARLVAAALGLFLSLVAPSVVDRLLTRYRRSRP